MEAFTPSLARFDKAQRGSCVFCRSAAFIPRNSRKAADSLKCESLRYPAAKEYRQMVGGLFLFSPDSACAASGASRLLLKHHLAFL